MNTELLMELLGGSVFPEDCYGRWEDVESNITTESVSANAESADSQILLQLRAALLQGLKGNLRLSKDILESRLEGMEYSDRWQFRLNTWIAFVAYVRRFPPLIKFRPELGGIMASERTHAIGYLQTATDHRGRLTNYQPGQVSFEKFEGQVVNILLGYPLCLWTSSFIQHPAYPIDLTANPEAMEQVAKQNQQLLLFQNIATENNMPGLGIYLMGLQTELVIGASSDTNSNSLKNLAAQCEARGDFVRAGTAKMKEADYRLAPPFSNPIALNLIPIDTDDVGIQNVRWDTTEDNLQLVDDPEAQGLYEEALACFERARSGRGQAAIFLRQGCLLHMQAYEPNLSFSERQERLEAARHRLETAQEKVGLDDTQMMLIKGHQLLLRISSSDHRLLREDAQIIGGWGRNMQNEGISHYIGWLIMRFGRRQLLACSQMRVALLCYRCAQDLFLSLGDEISAFQAAVAEMQLYISWTNNSAARSLVDYQLPIFRRITSRILNEYTNSPRPQMQLLLRHNLLVTYGSILSHVYRVAGDPDALIRWKEERRKLHDHPETQEVLKATVKIPNLMENVIGDILTPEEQNTLFETEQKDQILFDHYHEADAAFQQCLLENEIDRGEHILQAFIDMVDKMDGTLHIKSQLKLYTCSQLGWTEKAKEFLETIPENKIYDRGLCHVAMIDKCWWRPKYTMALRSADSCENAITCCALARDWSRGLAVVEAVQDLYPGFLDLEHGERVKDPWSRLTWIGLIEEHSGRNMQAFHHLLIAAKYAETHRSNGVDIDSKTSTFGVRSTAELFGSLARLCLRCHDSQLPLQIINSCNHQHPFAKSWSEHALIFLEQGNARTLLDTINAPGADSLEAQSKERIKHQLRRRTQLQALSVEQRTTEESSELSNIEMAVSEYAAHLEIDADSNTEVQLDMDPQSWCGALESDAVVVYWKFSRYGSLAFAITSLGVHFVKKEDFRDVDLRKGVMRVMKELKIYGMSMNSTEKASLEATLKDLASQIIEPFRDFIVPKRRIIFICSQPMNMFPFGALPFGDEPLCMQKVVSQVPSLMLLQHLWRNRVEGSIAPQLSAIVKANGTYTNTDDGEEYMIESPLPMAGIEALASARLFQTFPLDGSSLQRQDFLTEFQWAEIMLLATHGTLDYRSPLLSSISLGEKLRVLDLVRCSKSPALIIFAACLSGLGSATAANDITGFSQSLLSNGCKAFIGALWKVNDISTMFFTTLFFRKIHESNGKMALDEIFHWTQREVYRMTPDGAKTHLEGLVETWNTILNEEQRARTLVHKGGWHLKQALRKLERIDWKHPFHYASMALVGDGTLKFVNERKDNCF